ncbi:hypothetical protein ATO12_11020 [Aquimarina atlantica]|uniref:Integrase n=1 Tax=Aquimarina atlantica TaxID=1317122 RepID=A0A023BMR5_9FLAO|nr:tyrosine-type recombinase/integrase [Aquimarina atlantica]EZH71286.1 hypothetical protein ATO12_11020 [Aquimarina atlantica]
MKTFKNYLLSKGFSTKTTATYQKNLLAFIVWTDTHQIEVEQTTYRDLLGYIQHLRNKNVSSRAIQSYINSLNHYYKWVIKRGLRNDNPTTNIDIKGIKRRNLCHILDKQELERIYYDYKELSSKSPSEKRNEIIVSLLVYQGLTTTELKKLTIPDIKLREGNIYIAATRRSNERTLKLESHQILDIMEYTLQTRPTILSETQKETDLFFVTSGSSLELQNVMQKLMQQLRKQSRKIESLKQIRTSVITHWLKNYNLREAQYMAGHRYVSSTEAYLINDLEGLQDDINTYHPIG